ncbi:hypothetical protein BKA93DRAFT_753770 [Sparassis latifolia]
MHKRIQDLHNHYVKGNFVQVWTLQYQISQMSTHCQLKEIVKTRIYKSVEIENTWLVHWQHYPTEYDSWVPDEDMANLSEELMQVHANHSRLSLNVILDAKQWLSALASQGDLNDQIAALPEGGWTGAGALVVLKQLSQMVCLLPQLQQPEAVVTTLQQAMLWATSRAYIVIYHWYSDIGPDMSNTLFEHYVQEGDARFKHLYPAFHSIIKHIYQYVEQHASFLKTQRGHKNPRTNEEANVQSSATPVEPFPLNVPKDLYGLDLKMRKSSYLLCEKGSL